MLASQKLAIRASEIRTKLAELAGVEGDLGDEAKGRDCQAARPSTRMSKFRYQAAATAEDVQGNEESTKRRPKPTSTGR